MPERKELLGRLLDCLAPQVEKYPDIEVMTKTSTRSRSVGDQRQEMLTKAIGEYVCFIDDDDLVSPVYIDTIYPLLNGVDYVGFPVKVLRDGHPYGVAYHSLKHREWTSHGLTSFRDISHLNPIKRELAVQAQMEGGYGEDHRWANRLRELGIVKTQNYTAEPMYYYMMRSYKPEMEPQNSCV